MTDNPVMPAGYERAIADAVERFVHAMRELSSKQMIAATEQITRDVQARYPGISDKALWFNYGRALGKLEEADRAMKGLPSLD